MKVSLLLLAFLSLCTKRVLAEYKIGIGIADVTGPIAEVTFMGYGKFEQLGSGLHLRQWARSYIISDGNDVVVFVNVDIGMMGQGVRLYVLEELRKKFGTLYNSNNVIISGTHTHSAPGGYLMYFLFDLPIRGFSIESFSALVKGITASIERAHNSMVDGRLFLAKGHLTNANVNRSPTAYLENPASEREKYVKLSAGCFYWDGRYDSNTDTEMVQIKFVTLDSEPLGVINWFPVHPTSMNNTNIYVSSDNVGYASIKFEEKMNPKRILGQGPFIASFASSNLGDVSPNLKPPKCLKSGKPCDIPTSSCSDPKDMCVSFGPGKDMFESTAIIADRLFQKAWELWEGPDTEIKGPVKAIHQYVDMPTAKAVIETPNGSNMTVGGCVPAMGYSFGAGTTDGPGAFSFKQGTLSNNPMWNIVRDIIAPPTPEDLQCQAPKPILIPTGRMAFPFEWQPRVVSTQLALLGNVALIAVPGEFTTMAGRRMKNKISKLMAEAGFETPTAIIAGLCNTYSDYITTFEEYQIQRYEGASTIFGPHTLSLYLAQYQKLFEALNNNLFIPKGPVPNGLNTSKLSFIPPVIFDFPRIGFRFGSSTLHPKETASPGETVIARFVSGHPRNNKNFATFCTIELQDNQQWIVVATDANWETKYVFGVKWIRTNRFLGYSETEIYWTIPEDVEPGFYRIKHYGYYKNAIGGIYPYEGTSRTFRVNNLK